MSGRTRRMVGHTIVEQLAYGGVTRVFGVPGESYLGVLDGLYEHRDCIDMIVARQEGGAAMMAAAAGRISGRPGVCMVTRGPGATNASIGVHVARQDASPMILFIGQVPRCVAGREAFQEIDYQLMFASVAKEVLEINRPERAGEIVSRALLTSMTGEPGPVVVVLPEDVLTTEVEDTVHAIEPPPEPGPHPTVLAEAVSMLESAERPIIVLGRQADHNACELLQDFAERSSIPIVTTVRSQDLIDNESAVYAGTLGLNTTPGLDQRVSRADVIVFLGTRPGLKSQPMVPPRRGSCESLMNMSPQTRSSRWGPAITRPGHRGIADTGCTTPNSGPNLVRWGMGFPQPPPRLSNLRADRSSLLPVTAAC